MRKYDSIDYLFFAAIACVWIAAISFWVGVGYVALHFITKYW